ncbi:putative NADH pyrophosphatase [Cladobotryum mycophilum]|uniref:NAD(+) diphosphatase n=1 Tax=Cladobotryum mycophilum TaxID=491253 RepID=A0ABR0S9T2_9HYPO
MSLSNLPENPDLAADDSMLTRRLGKEVINYYAGSRLNRYSFLRSDSLFIQSAVTSPSTRFLALKDLSPLVADSKTLALFSYEEVKPFVGAQPLGLSDGDNLKAFDSSKPRPLVVFLGLLPDTEQSEQFATEKHGTVKGQPYFALDITQNAPYAEAAKTFLEAAEARGLSLQTNIRSMTLNPEAAAIFAQSRSIIDWNARNTFCAGCGNLNLSSEAGYKRVCPPTDVTPSGNRDHCHTRKGVSNVCFPRTDPTMIAAIVSADGQRVLLGRQSSWPAKWYSTLAGFLEPGESIEDSVRREVWEESGVKVGRVVVHSSQPWPFPSSLMIGAIAQALPDGEAIELNDKELEDARWFSFNEVREALTLGTSALGEEPSKEYTGDLRLPPPQAIANRLLTAVVEGYLLVAPKI